MSACGSWDTLWDGVTGQTAANEARDALNASSNASIGLQREMWQKGLDMSQPFYDAGVNALGQMQKFQAPSFSFGDFQASPDYQFRLNSGLDAINSRAGAGGMRLSGRTLQGMMDYGQNLASSEYNNWYNRRNQDYARTMGESQDQWNRLAQLSGMGAGANSQSVAATQNAANGMANQLNNIGQANAGAAMQGYNGAVGLIGGGLQTAGSLGWKPF